MDLNCKPIVALKRKITSKLTVGPRSEILFEPTVGVVEDYIIYKSSTTPTVASNKILLLGPTVGLLAIFLFNATVGLQFRSNRWLS